MRPPAMDAEARERIGGTGSVVGILLDMFLHPGVDADAARTEAGEALAMLALESLRNWELILRAAAGGGNSSTVHRLVDALEDAAVGVGASRILTNICVYSGGGGEWFPHLRSATRGAAMAWWRSRALPRGAVAAGSGWRRRRRGRESGMGNERAV
ncbi:unnamed protein product [Urochloa humidicola]